jgi:hypothetical protein
VEALKIKAIQSARGNQYFKILSSTLQKTTLHRQNQPWNAEWD